MLSVSEMSIELTSGNMIRSARMCYLISIMEILLAAKGGVVGICVTAIKRLRMFASLLNYKALHRKYDEMKADMDTLSCASVDSLLIKIKNLASRPIVEFNKYEVLDFLEVLKNTACDVHHEKEGYFRLAYETLRGKLDQPNQMFRKFLLPLLGDKDHEKS